MFSTSIALLQSCRRQIQGQISEPEETVAVNELGNIMAMLQTAEARKNQGGQSPPPGASTAGFRPFLNQHPQTTPPATAKPMMPGPGGGVVRPSPKGGLGGFTSKPKPPPTTKITPDDVADQMDD